MKKVLITGATGYVGNYLLKYLDKNKIDVSVLSRNIVDGYETYLCDYERDKIPINCFINVNTVVHLAAYSKDEGKFSERVKNKYLNFNHNKTLELADLSISANIRNFIFISSSKANKYSHVDRIDLVNDYGSLKRYTEIKLIKKFDKTNLNLKIIRYPMIYGPKMKNNLNLMRKAIKYGLFPTFPEINNRKQLIHIDSVIKSIYQIIKMSNREKIIYFFADKEVYTTRKIQRILCKIENKKRSIFRFPLSFLKKLAYLSSYFSLIILKLTEEDYYADVDFISEVNKPKTLFNIDETNL